MANNKKAVVLPQCVACGCCVKACPFQAVQIHKGLFARVDEKKCRGCGKCQAACPADVIRMAEREGAPA